MVRTFADSYSAEYPKHQVIIFSKHLSELVIFEGSQPVNWRHIGLQRMFIGRFQFRFCVTLLCYLHLRMTAYCYVLLSYSLLRWPL